MSLLDFSLFMSPTDYGFSSMDSGFSSSSSDYEWISNEEDEYIQSTEEVTRTSAPSPVIPTNSIVIRNLPAARKPRCLFMHEYILNMEDRPPFFLIDLSPKSAIGVKCDTEEAARILRSRLGGIFFAGYYTKVDYCNPLGEEGDDLARDSIDGPDCDTEEVEEDEAERELQQLFNRYDSDESDEEDEELPSSERW